MIVTIKLPAGTKELWYGLVPIAINGDCTVDVPQYVAAPLIALGGKPLTYDDRVPKRPVAELLAEAPAWQTGWLLHALGLPPLVGRPDRLAYALAVIQVHGEPLLAIH